MNFLKLSLNFLFNKLLRLDILFLKKERKFNVLINNSKLIKSSRKDEVLEALKLLIPNDCSKPLIRIGGEKDGAYLLPDDLQEIDACFSPGTSDTKFFEDELAMKYKIKSYMSDASIKESSLSLIKDFQFFQRKWISSFNYKNHMTLENWIIKNDLEKSNNLLLQMDIESSEYLSLLATPSSFLKKFRIIILELHELYNLKNSRFLEQIYNPVMKKILESFDCVHAHPNNDGDWNITHGYKIPNIIELTFYRKDLNLIKKFKSSIPHKLDIKMNKLDKENLSLEEPWN